MCPACPPRISIALLALRTETRVIRSLKRRLRVPLAVGKRGCPGCRVSRGQRCPVLVRNPGLRDVLPAGGRASAAFSLGGQGSSNLGWSFWGRLLAPGEPLAWSPGRQHSSCSHGGTTAVPRPPSSWAQELVLL